MGLTLACSDVTAPGAPARLVVRAGAQVVDTIGAEVAPLRVALTDASGRALRGVDVVVTPVPMPAVDSIWRPYDHPHLSVRSHDGRRPESEPLRDTTDAAGEVSLRVTLGSVAGVAALALSAPSLDLADTVRFTVLPGRPRSIELTSALDTALTVGARATLEAFVVDRMWNRRPDAAVFGSTDRELAVSARGELHALAVGRATVVARFPGTDSVTTFVSVVPAGTLAVQRLERGGSFLGVMNVDGTGFRRVPFDGVPGLPEVAWDGFGPRWSADGQALLVNAFEAVYRVSLDGVRHAVASSIVPRAAGPDRLWPVRYLAGEGPDGWIYHTASCGGGEILYRSRPGSAVPPERLSPAPFTGGEDEDPAFVEYMNCQLARYHWPALAPDGRHVVFTEVTWQAGSDMLAILDLATRTVRSLEVVGFMPSWSPTGDRIAYVLEGGLWIVRPDGTGRRRLATERRDYGTAVTWSPDGAYLLARSGGVLDATLVLIDVATGREIPLPYSYWRRPQENFVVSYGQPDWRRD